MNSSLTTRLGLMAAILVAMAPVIGGASAQTIVTYHEEEDHPGGPRDVEAEDALPWKLGSALAVSPFNLAFTTPEDALAYWDMAIRAYSSPVPDARTVAREFLREHLGLDGDAYVVAHFATPAARAKGEADHVMALTDAVMEAFPDHSRHTVFALAADAVGGVNAGGQSSPGLLAFVEDVGHGRNAKECFSTIGRFLWSRTGPGYIYNTFFSRGNVVETVREDLRSLDEAFGIFAAGGDFTREAPLRLSRLVAMFEADGVFSELPYVKRLRHELDAYWQTSGAEWPVLARYRFVQQARRARLTGGLTQEQYELVMRGGAAHVPLDGEITLAQLRDVTPLPEPVRTRRLDINGYVASNLVRFIAGEGSEVLYLPGHEVPFVVFHDEEDLRRWILTRAKDPGKLDVLLSHFSNYDNQDGVFWTGVQHALDNIAQGRWKPDAGVIDHTDAAIVGDVFEDMRVQTEKRMRDDARMQASTAWEAWRTTLNRTAALLGPVGYAPPLAIPVQVGTGLLSVGTGIDQGVRGRTAQARKSGFGQAVMTVVASAPLGIGFGRPGGTTPRETPEGAGKPPGFVPPRRINGRIGYLMGPVKPLRILPTIRENQTYPRLDPLLEGSVWTPRDVQTELREGGYTVQVVPEDSPDRVDAIIDLKKQDIADRRADLRDISDETLTRNTRGYLSSSDHAIAFRVDSRPPQALLENGGFGPSRDFVDVQPMLTGSVTIGSDSWWASDGILREWARDPEKRGKATFHQYVVWTQGREVAAVSDNEIAGADSAMDEVHFPGGIGASDIYIIDSTNPEYARVISEILESHHVSTPYGVPLEAFSDYIAGRLDIHAPNRFSEHHLDGDLVSVPAGHNANGEGRTSP